MSQSEGAELSRRRRGSSPAALTSLTDGEYMLQEILLRLPPQPSSLPRASAVCRRWRRLATDPKFIVSFRAHHRKPLLLGVFHQSGHNIVFTPILDPPDRIPPGRLDLRIRDGRKTELLGCCHGRALLLDHLQAEVVVFDPIIGEQLRVPFPSAIKKYYLNGAVVCAAGDQGHVHGNCLSSPFKVVLVFLDSSDSRPLACVYSSETGTWGNFIPSEVPSPISCGGSPSTLIGNVLYWPLRLVIDCILEFDLDRQRLDVVKGPPGMNHGHYILHQIIEVEDGNVGLAIYSRQSLQMWQRKVNSRGDTTWLLWKTIQKHDILGIPPNIEGNGGLLEKFLGYDEDTNTVFFYADDSVYMFQLLHIKKLYDTPCYNTNPCYPFLSFYTPAITGAGAEMLHDR